MKFQIVGYALGILITIVGLAEMAPAMVDWRDGHENAWAFFFNGIVCVFFGGSLILSNRGADFRMTLRQAFLLTASLWGVIGVFCALPLYMSDLNLTYVDAFFEAVSGITTTGATVLTGLDGMSAGVLLWRSMMQWAGGLGIIVFAIVFLPYLKVGGMQIFHSEESGTSEKVMPRTNEVVGSLFKVYLLITGVCAAVYLFLGMGWFDALNHAFTTVSTGGFSTHDASFQFFESAALEYAAIFFMILAALPFLLYVRMFFQGRFLFLRDEQVRAFFVMLIVSIAVLSLWLFFYADRPEGDGFRAVLFSVVSILTTTGFVTVDYTLWGGFALLGFLLLSYTGACAGSTAGGAKMMRVVIAGKVVARQFKILLYPSGVFVLNYQGRRLDNNIILAVLGFLSLYVMTNVAVTILLSLTGLDFETSLSAAASALANIGPGVGGMVGPMGHYGDLSSAAKWILCAGMIIGRLEILTILVLMSPAYWRP